MEQDLIFGGMKNNSKMLSDFISGAKQLYNPQLEMASLRLKAIDEHNAQRAKLQDDAARATIEATKYNREHFQMLEGRLGVLEAENRKLKEERQHNLNASRLWSNQRVVSKEETGRVWDTSFNFIRVFLSHKTEHKVQVGELKNLLWPYGIDCFVAHNDIEPTEAWQIEIENALLTMDIFVAIMTPDFHTSLWTDQEIGFACARNVTRIAVRMGCDPYGFIGRNQGLNADWTDLSGKITTLLKNHPKMVDALIDAMAICPSACVGNQLAKNFKSLETLSDIQLGKFLANYNANQQVYGSYEMNGSGEVKSSILPHLQRMTGRKFSFDKNRIVEEPSK
jgi:TIR domain